MFWLDSLYRDAAELYAVMLARRIIMAGIYAGVTRGLRYEKCGVNVISRTSDEMTCQQQVQLGYMFKSAVLYRHGSAGW